jgi:hypothetical protein
MAQVHAVYGLALISAGRQGVLLGYMVLSGRVHFVYPLLHRLTFKISWTLGLS